METTAICDLCKKTNDLEHIILKCKKFQSCRDNLEFNEKPYSLTELLQKIDIKTYREIVNFYLIGLMI